jgi:PAS domain-containing protein
MWRTRYWERAGSWALVFAAAGGAAGVWFRRRRRHFIKRLEQILMRRRQAHHRVFRDGQTRAEERFLHWIQQALVFSSDGVVLLDGHQHIVAFNRRAEEAAGPLSAGQGRHWLELEGSAEWAEALRTTLDHPGIPIPGPCLKDRRQTSLLTFLQDDQCAGSTWLIVRAR